MNLFAYLLILLLYGMIGYLLGYCTQRSKVKSLQDANLKLVREIYSIHKVGLVLDPEE